MHSLQSESDKTNCNAETSAIAAAVSSINISDEEKDKLLTDLHQIAHEGSSRLAQRCKLNGHNWPGLHEDCIKHVQSCIQCLRFNITQQGFHPSKTQISNQPMSHVAIDLAGPLPISRGGEKFILVIIDLFSKFIFLHALKEKSAQTIAASLFLTFCNFGHPEVLISDNGSEFINSIMKELTSLFSINHRRSCPYHPQANGSAERAVKSTLDLLRKELDGVHGDWAASIPAIQFRLNNRLTEISNSMPFEVMFCRGINPLQPCNPSDFAEPPAEALKERLELAQQVVFPALTERSAKVYSKRNQRLDKSRKLTNFPIGSLVMAKNPNPQSKLDLRYLGPFKVCSITPGGSYVLADATGNTLRRRFPPNLLKISSATEPTNHHYVEKIVESKIENGIELFRVRWFGFPESEDTWEPSEAFDDPMIIQNFKSSI